MRIDENSCLSYVLEALLAARHTKSISKADVLLPVIFGTVRMGAQSRPVRRSWTERRRIMAILRLAARVLLKGQKRSVGTLGRGATVAAVLAALGVFVPQAAMAQYAAGGGTASAANSIAIGSGSTAGGSQGIAIGTGANSGTQNQSLAIGPFAVASGDQSTALGNNVVASGNSSVAIGGDDLDKVATARGALYTSLTGGTLSTGVYIATTAGDGSVAIGVEGTASANFATAIGLKAAASGDGSFAIGAATTASGQASGAIGLNSAATGLNAIAIGVDTRAAANYATAIGSGGNSVATATQAGAAGATAIGGNATLGAAATAADSIAIGGQSAASQTEAVAIGKSAAASGVDSIAIGQTAKASGTQSISIGFQNNVSGANSVAIGDPNIVTGTSAFVLGDNNTVAGNNTVTVGNSNSNAGNNSFIIGNSASTTAATSGSIVIGDGAATRSTVSNGTVLGSGASVTLAGSVALGSASSATAVTATNSATVGTTIFAGFAGTTPNSTVSIGNAGTERTLTNVAAGRISAISTDAVNGSELFTVATLVDANKIGIATINSTGAKYFHANSALADSVATGVNSVAVGPLANAWNSGDVAFGRNATSGVSAGAIVNDTAIGNNSSATGGNSTALGQSANASGATSTAIGSAATAFATDATAVGNAAKANAAQATALGVATTASGGSSAAVGNGATASGTNSLAFGVGTTANAFAALSLGNISTASGSSSTALGDHSQATAGNATAIGSGGASTVATATTASGAGATAIGGNATNGAVASGVDSIAIGGQSAASGSNTVAIGLLSAATVNDSTAVGERATAAGINSLALGVLANTGAAGNGIAVGGSATASGGSATAIGGNSLASATFALALGDTAKATGTSTLALGRTASASATEAIAIGLSAAASGVDSIAIGQTAKASGTQSISIGFQNNVSGANSVAIGDPNIVTGTSAFVLGDTNTVAGNNSVTMGNSNSNAGNNSFIIGNSASTTAATSGSIVIGDGAATRSTASNGTVLGSGASVTLAGSVALGSASSATAVAATSTATVGASTYAGFAGTTPASTVSIGSAGTERTLTNVAAGRISASSTDAVNGSQLFSVATQVDANKTSIATINSTGAKYFHAGSVLGDSAATGADSVAVGPLAVAGGGGSVALGNGAQANNQNDVALGAGSRTGAPNTGVTDRTGGTAAAVQAAASLAGTVSVGTAGGERQVQNVAAGTLSAASTDAVNGSQLFSVASASNNLGASLAAALGSGAVVGADGKVVTAPSFTVGAVTYSTVGSALAGLQGSAPVQYSTAAAPLTPNGFVPSQNLTLVGSKAGTPVTLSNVAPGTLSAASTDAVNGAQLAALGSSAASAAGGGSAFDPATGGITAPAYTIGSTTYNNTGSALAALDGSVNGGKGIKYFHAGSVLGDSAATGTDSVAVGPLAVAGDVNAMALGNSATASKAFAVALGSNSVASGISSLALGDGAVAAFNQSVALGAGSVSGLNNNSNGAIILAGATAPIGLTFNNAKNTTIGAVSVGSGPTNLRQVQNVADGVASSDAVTVQQLTGVVTAANAALVPLQATAKLAVTYTPDKSGNATPLVDLTSNPTLPAGTKSVTLTGVGPGALTANSLDAVNGSQVFALGSTAASTFGAGATFDPATGKITAPAYTIAGSTFNNVGSALAQVDKSISGGAGIKYFHTNSALGDSTATGADAVAIGPLANASGKNSVVLGANSTDGGLANVVSIGAAGAERKLINLAAGSVSATSTDAVNGGQLNTVSTSVASALGGGASFDPATGKVTAPTYTIGGTGYNNAGSAFNALDTSINGGGGIKYFHASSTLGDSSATGTNSVAIGPAATSSGKNSVAIGAGSTDGGIANVVSVGAVGAERKITNVAAGALTATSTEAVNGSQVNAGLASAAAGLGGGAIFDPATGKITGPAYTVAGNTYNDVGSALGAQGKLSVQYVPDSKGNPTGAVNLAGNSSLPAGTTAVALTGVANATQASGAVALGQLPIQYSTAAAPTTANPAVSSNDVTLVGASSGPVVIHNVGVGVAATDGVNVSQLNAVAGNAVQYGTTSTGGRSNTLSLLGGDATKPVTIANVAAGVNATDAANVGQLNNLAAYTQQQVNRLDANIAAVKRQAYTGTAIALAASGLRYNDQPGKTAAAGAIANYKGKLGMALGLGHTSENGRWRYNIAASFAPQNITKDIGIVAGASYTFD